ncbi:MAG TPA: hypothetical protein VH951_05750 [Dehalococcoidia bacterium]
MAEDAPDQYLTVDQAAKVFGVSQAAVRRVLRAYGLGDFVRDSMRREVLASRADLERILRSPDARKGAA